MAPHPECDYQIDAQCSYNNNISNDYPRKSEVPRKSSVQLPKLLFGLLLFALMECQCTAELNTVVEFDGTVADEGAGGILWKSLEATDEEEMMQRERRARRLTLGSSEGTSSEMGWRKRYYVSRWRGGKANRRFVPISKNDESSGSRDANDMRRLCGLKLTNRTKQLCGDCVPSNMRQVILLDKKNDNNASSKDRLTEMCCVQRCTDEQIRNFCCRGQL